MTPFDPDTITLTEAWEAMVPAMEGNGAEGARCLLCGKYLRVYYRNLGHEIAQVAIVLHRWNLANPGEWAFLAKLGVTGKAGYRGDYAWGRYWGLYEQRDDPRPDGYKHAGWWRITDLGTAWVTSGLLPEPRRLKLPRYVRTFQEAALGPPWPYTEKGTLMPDVGVRDAAGEHFNYERLMAGEA